jgi:hypothetical protein
MRWEWDEVGGRPSVVVADPPETPQWAWLREWLPLRARNVRFHDGSPQWKIEGDLAETGLIRAASSVVGTQKKWLNRWHPNRFTYQSMKDDLAPADAEPEILGYLEEALHDTHTQRLKDEVRGCPGKVDATIKDHLDWSLRKVNRLRKKRGLETAIDVVEPGYRQIGKAVWRKRLLED